MFDIEILGYSFYYEHDKNKYPIVKIEASHEDHFFITPINFERVYDAFDWVYHRLDGTLDDMIKNFVDELWKGFHKGIPKVYEISLYISLPVEINMWIKEHIRNEFEKRLAIKFEEDKFYRELSNSRFGLLLPEHLPYIDTDTVDSIMDSCRYIKDIENAKEKIKEYEKMKIENVIFNDTWRKFHEIAKDRENAREKIKEYEKMKIENVIFNDPATIVFWRDGSKTVVKAKDEPYDPEKGLAMAIAKKAYGNKGNYYNEFKKFIKDEPIAKVSSIEAVLDYLEPKEDNKNE